MALAIRISGRPFWTTSQKEIFTHRARQTPTCCCWATLRVANCRWYNQSTSIASNRRTSTLKSIRWAVRTLLWTLPTCLWGTFPTRKQHPLCRRRSRARPSWMFGVSKIPSELSSSKECSNQMTWRDFVLSWFRTFKNPGSLWIRYSAGLPRSEIWPRISSRNFLFQRKKLWRTS